MVSIPCAISASTVASAVLIRAAAFVPSDTDGGLEGFSLDMTLESSRRKPECADHFPRVEPGKALRAAAGAPLRDSARSKLATHTMRSAGVRHGAGCS